MKIGEFYSESFSFSQEDVNLFAKLTGDSNPIHLDEKYSAETIFKKPIIHGYLASSIFSKILGMNFPGEGTIYLKQELKFKKPMFVDSHYEATVVVKNIYPEKFGILFETTICEKDSQNTTVQGEALVMNKNISFED